MKMVTKIVLLVVVLLIVGAVAAPAMAQEGQPGLEFPPTAVEAVGLLVTFIGSAFGIGSVTTVLVDVLKKINWLRFLGPDHTARIGGLMAEIAVIVVASFSGWAAQEYLVPFAQYLDQIGVWPIVGASIPFARWLYWRFKEAQLRQALQMKELEAGIR